jgi:Fibronectin type III domain
MHSNPHVLSRRRARRAASTAVAILVGLAAVASTRPADALEPCDPDHITPLCDDQSSEFAPTGLLVSASRRPGGLLVSGWAHDQDAPSGPVTVRVKLNGQIAGTVTADTARAEGTLGFEGVVATSLTGTVTVQAFAVDDAGMFDVAIGSKQLSVSADPFGYLDDVQSGVSSVWVRGWAIDPDVATPIAVHVYQDGIFVNGFTADSLRNDVSAVYPGYGTNHGFDITVPHASNGQHTICVYGINTGPGSVNTSLGCKSYTENHSPPAAPTLGFLMTYQDVVDGPYHATLYFTDNSTDEDSFQVYIQGGVYTAGTWIGSVQGDTTTGNDWLYLPGVVDPSTTYTFWVYAYTNFANSVSSTSYTTPRLPPLAPKNLTAMTTTETSVTFQWDDRSNDEDAFDLEYWVSGSLVGTKQADHASAPAHAGTGTSMFTLSGLQPATTYCATVHAAYQQLRSLGSNVVCQATKTPPPPAAPSAVSVSASSQIALNVQWNDNATNETGYRVERLDNNAWVIRTSLSAGATSYTDTGLTAGTTHCYRVVAFNAGGSTASASACGTTQSAQPKGVKTANIWNCDSQSRTNNGCGTPFTSPAATVNLPNGHWVTLAAVILDSMCTTEDPTATKCRHWELVTLGDANGTTNQYTIS